MITVNEADRIEFNYVIDNLNLTQRYLVKPIPEETPLEQVEEYYSALMLHFKELKVKEHKLRCLFTKKYNVPYTFSYQDGIIAEDG